MRTRPRRRPSLLGSRPWFGCHDDQPRAADLRAVTAVVRSIVSRGSEVDSEAVTLPATAHDHGESGAEPPDPLIGSVIGSYKVEALLGQGGMGSVYRAVHPRIGTQVAIKVLHASLARSSTVTERFEREARASGAIGSPYIPKFYDFGVLEDGCTYAVLDYYDGESVADRLERGPIELSARSMKRTAVS